MDGKVLRGSFDHFEDRKKAQVLSALATGSELVQLKRNQPTLHNAMVSYSDAESPQDSHKIHQSGKRNKIETRIASTWLLEDNVGKEAWQDHFKTLIRVQKNTRTKKCNL